MDNMTTIEQPDLPMNHEQCLEDYVARIDLAWSEIHRRNLHHNRLFAHDAAKISSTYRLSSVLVLDLHARLQANLISSLGMDHYLYAKGDRVTPGMEIPFNLRDQVAAEIETLRRKRHD